MIQNKFVIIVNQYILYIITWCIFVSDFCVITCSCRSVENIWEKKRNKSILQFITKLYFLYFRKCIQVQQRNKVNYDMPLQQVNVNFEEVKL